MLDWKIGNAHRTLASLPAEPRICKEAYVEWQRTHGQGRQRRSHPRQPTASAVQPTPPPPR